MEIVEEGNKGKGKEKKCRNGDGKIRNGKKGKGGEGRIR